ncbi:MAG: T9SS type A sorting domain-containing protein [Ignavibacteria bacterium]
MSATIFSQWQIVTQIPQAQLGDYPSISVPNCSTFVIAGGSIGNPRVFISTDNGVNFANITGNITGTELFSVWALNSDTIFAGDGGSPSGGGGNAKIYKTTNRGANWSVILQTGGNSGFIGSIIFQKPQQNFGIIISDPPLENTPYWIAKTTDKGNTWNVSTAPYIPTYATQNSGFIVDSSFYGFGTQQPGKIYITTNAGSNWSSYLIGLNSNSIPSISFESDKLTGIAISDISLPNIARTTNGGINWQTINIPGTSGEGDVKWIEGTDIFFFSANKLSRSSNDGTSWSDMNSSGVSLFEHFDYYKSGANTICAYAVATDGRVLRYEGDPFGIDPNNTTIPAEYVLDQNYPNPFNPVTTVKYSIPLAGIVKLAIYDLNGREILNIFNRYHNAGNYIETFDMTNFSSGVYFYELTSGKTSLTKKLALIK